MSYLQDLEDDLEALDEKQNKKEYVNKTFVVNPPTIAIRNILYNKNIDNFEKRRRLNGLDCGSQYVFIKTHLCSCGKMKVEVWTKEEEFEV